MGGGGDERIEWAMKEGKKGREEWECKGILTVENKGQSFGRKRNERKYFQGGKVTKD